MSRRIFIAINLPDEVRKEIVSYQKKMKELFNFTKSEYSFQDDSKEPINWTRKENLHITLVFIGYVKDDDLPSIFKTTKDIVKKYKSFSIDLNNICYGPPKKNPPRMIWVTGEKSETLGKLQTELQTSLLNPWVEEPSKIKSKAFSPHITLGRIRKWEFKKIDPEERPQIEESFLLNFRVKSIKIVESELKKTGPEYTVLDSVSLPN